MVGEYKKCEFCGEEIKTLAIKCRFCGEFLNISGADVNSSKINSSNLPINPPPKSSVGKVLLIVILLSLMCVCLFFGLSYIGTQTVQRLSRDTQRRSFVEAINLEIGDYYEINKIYPESGTVTISRVTNKITIGTDGKTIQFSGAGLPVSGTTASTSAGSVYCYKQIGNTYTIGVSLESGYWFNLGNASTTCNNANL